ncbi:MAG: DMT family transporter [Polyangiaceae bacterium]|nr:DMT family transporter [Polyangiaceae bacterium]
MTGRELEPGVPGDPSSRRGATGLALAAIGLWSSLAALSVELAHVPPLLLVGCSLCIGSLVGVPRFREWRVPWPTLLLGCYGLFGYHFCLFMALRFAPPVEANLVNYLWPLLMVLLAPLVLRGARLGARHVAGALAGLAGTVVLVSAEGAPDGSGRHLLGYLLGLAAALMWSTYSLFTRRVRPFPTGAVGGFCALSGLLALGAHVWLEPPYCPSLRELALLVPLGLGPMGAAFFLWDAALKRGDPRSIGTLAYLTPLLSTGWLALFAGGELGPRAGVALALILAGAWLGNRQPRRAPGR